VYNTAINDKGKGTDKDRWPQRRNPAYVQENGEDFTAAMLANMADEDGAEPCGQGMAGHASFCVGQYHDKNIFGPRKNGEK